MNLFKRSVVLIATCYSMQGFAQDLQAINTTLSDVERRLVSWVDGNEANILGELKSHVDINTGTANIAGLDNYRDILQRELVQLGFATSTHSSPDIPVLTCEGGKVQIADHLLATRDGAGKQSILLNGHLDTVFSAGDEFQTLMVERDGTLKGPGVADMKGGIVIMLNALRALNAEQLLDGSKLTVLLNTDEEIGSLGSRKLIEQQAKLHDIGLVFEGSYQNKVTRARKGLGQARIRIIGRESHAGGAHEEGVSANLELAHKVVEIEQMTDYQRKVTVNTGVMAGGEKRNTISGCAEAYIDMRFPTAEDGEQLKQRLIEIASSATVTNPRYPEFPQIESWATLHRPVKAQNDMVDQLISQAMGISKLVGEPIVGTRYSGGGTDGSIAQAVGLPTMDSLGMDGIGAHSSREAASVKSLIARTKLAAVLLNRLIHQ
ncbi:MAG: glutamate carboxypeptidase [Cryomorphaceae bacterium]|jgi:glutamate carboxypeptidase